MPCQYPWVALIGFITFQELNYHGHTTDTTILSFSFCNLKFQQLMRFSSFPLFTFSLKLIFLSFLSLFSFFIGSPSCCPVSPYLQRFQIFFSVQPWPYEDTIWSALHNPLKFIFPLSFNLTIIIPSSFLEGWAPREVPIAPQTGVTLSISPSTLEEPSV